MKTKILISEEKVMSRVMELGKQISADYENKKLLIVSVLRGSFMFTADLVKYIDGEFMIEFIQCSSYGHGTESSGKLTITKGIEIDITDYDILVVDDIADSGLSMNGVIEYIATKNPRSIKTCTFLDKPIRRKIDFKVDYVGYEIEDLFVVGYGLDYKGCYRNKPYIFTVIEE